MFEDALWYLSSNGNDTASCGHNISMACKTLDWLLGRFYKGSYNPTLSLITDSSLLIDNHLIVSYCIWFIFLIQMFIVDKQIEYGLN